MKCRTFLPPETSSNLKEPASLAAASRRSALTESRFSFCIRRISAARWSNLNRPNAVHCLHTEGANCWSYDEQDHRRRDLLPDLVGDAVCSAALGCAQSGGKRRDYAGH